jgi:hypothetical protein
LSQFLYSVAVASVAAQEALAVMVLVVAPEPPTEALADLVAVEELVFLIPLPPSRLVVVAEALAVAAASMLLLPTQQHLALAAVA